MKRRHRAYHWWKQKPSSLRMPLIFVIGVLLIILAPFVGLIPGPGGILIFLAGIAVLATEFDWAENLKNFFLETVPKEVKKRWQPTPVWETVFDVTVLLLLVLAAGAIWLRWWPPVVSLSAASLCLWLFNRNRLERFKAWRKRRR